MCDWDQNRPGHRSDRRCHLRHPVAWWTSADPPRVLDRGSPRRRFHARIEALDHFNRDIRAPLVLDPAAWATNCKRRWPVRSYFTAPSVRPRTRWRCTRRAKITIGSAPITPAAAIEAQSVSMSVDPVLADAKWRASHKAPYQSWHRFAARRTVSGDTLVVQGEPERRPGSAGLDARYEAGVTGRNIGGASGLVLARRVACSSETSSVPGKDGEDPADERVERCHVVAQELLCRSHCDLAIVRDQTGGELDVGLGRAHLG
jgi:hypothetical protein